MANKKLTKALAIALASEYCCNGFHKGQALRTCGYSEAYSKTTAAGKVFDTELVCAEMEAIVRRNQAAVDVTVGEIIQGLRSIAFPAEGVKVNNSDRNAALVSLAKFKNMLTDRLILEPGIEQREFSEREKVEAQIIAEIRLRSGDEIQAEVDRRIMGEAEPTLQLPTDEEIING